MRESASSEGVGGTGGGFAGSLPARPVVDPGGVGSAGEGRSPGGSVGTGRSVDAASARVASRNAWRASGRPGWADSPGRGLSGDEGFGFLAMAGSLSGRFG